MNWDIEFCNYNVYSTNTLKITLLPRKENYIIQSYNTMLLKSFIIYAKLFDEPFGEWKSSHRYLWILTNQILSKNNLLASITKRNVLHGSKISSN